MWFQLFHVRPRFECNAGAAAMGGPVTGPPCDGMILVENRWTTLWLSRTVFTSTLSESRWVPGDVLCAWPGVQVGVVRAP